MYVPVLCLALSLVPALPTPGSVTFGDQSSLSSAAEIRGGDRPLAVGVTGLAYVERSEPGLDGATIGGSIVFTARAHPRLSVYFEGGRARFYADDQPGHRDFFASGLLGFHLQPSSEGLVLLAGATLLHSERHKFFGDLASNQAALTLGADYVWAASDLICLAATWRTDVAAEMTVHRPGFSVRFRF